MRFALAALLFMYVGRRVGWALSRNFLYHAPIVVSFLMGAGWGVGVGIGMSGLIGWLQPNVLLKWILGFALAAYVSIPNFGLIDESTIGESGCDVWTLARIAGHSSIKMSERYVHPGGEAVLNAMNRLSLPVSE